MPEHIPPELVEQILHHLSDDKEALRACSLVCSSWIPLSQQFLFEQFVLDDSEYRSPAKTCEALLQLLGHSPHIASYFKSMDILFQFCYPTPDHSQFEDLECLSKLFSHFTNIRRLHIEAYARNWMSLPVALTQPLRHVVSRPRFEHLSFAFVGFAVHGLDLIDFLSECSPTLRVLELDDASFDVPIPNGREFSTSRVEFPALEEFKCTVYGNSSREGEVFFKAGSLLMPNLRQYHGNLDITRPSPPWCPYTIPPFVPATLSEFRLWAYGGSSRGEAYYVSGFAEHPNLRHIEIETRCYGDVHRHVTLNFLRDLLRTISPHHLPLLENFSIIILNETPANGQLTVAVGTIVDEFQRLKNGGNLKRISLLLKPDSDRIPESRPSISIDFSSTGARSFNATLNPVPTGGLEVILE